MDSTNIIPKLEENIPNLEKLLASEEAVLEEIKENSKGDTYSVILVKNRIVLQTICFGASLSMLFYWVGGC